MADDHLFSFEVAPDRLIEGRYRWRIYEGHRTDTLSPDSYASEREAKIEAEKAIAGRIALWSRINRS
jgi:hypothetical protein